MMPSERMGGRGEDWDAGECGEKKGWADLFFFVAPWERLKNTLFPTKYVRR